MMVGVHFYIGLSERTNAEGARQMISILEAQGLSGSTVQMPGMLHLKSGLSYLENNTLVACGEFLHEQEFAEFNLIGIDAISPIASPTNTEHFFAPRESEFLTASHRPQIQ